jgi:hypothetical protein
MSDSAPKEFDLLQDGGDQFYMMMGQCIGVWVGGIEDYFFEICHTVLRSPSKQAAIVFYKTPTLDARMTLTDELVKLVLPQHKADDHPHEDLKLWVTTYKMIDKLKPVRNRIAHCQAGVNISQAGSWWILYESNNERMRGKPGAPPLQIVDLTRHLIDVGKARSLLHNFYYSTLPKYASKPPQ